MLLDSSTAIDSATTAKEGENEEYSEWRLFVTSVRGVGYSFQNVVVNEGFQNRDFQTKQGTVSSVIDPELLGKIRKEAADIWNMESNKRKSQHLYMAVMFGPCLCLALVFFGRFLLGQGPVVDVITDSIIVFGTSHVYMMISGICFSCYESAKPDARATALVKSYDPMFLKEYGIKLGYDKFKVSPKVEDSPICPCIYLRRSRRLVDEEEAPPAGHSGKDMDTFFPPIYVTRLIPGEISIEEKDYAATASLMKEVDADAWLLLQSTHQTMTRWHPSMKCFAILVLLALYPVFVCLLIIPYFGFLNIWTFFYIVILVYEYARDNRNLRLYEEVTKVVNSALQKDKKTAHLAVEFHASELPGREGKLGRRYQFVPHAEQWVPRAEPPILVQGLYGLDGNLV